jgi:hypothetical protein
MKLKTQLYTHTVCQYLAKEGVLYVLLYAVSS